MKTTLLLLCLAGTVVIGAQAQTSPTDPRDEIRRLSWLLGSWEGAGWIELAATNRIEISGVFLVQSKLDGRVYLMESRLEPRVQTPENRSMRDADLSVLAFDTTTRGLRLHRYGSNGVNWECDVTSQGQSCQMSVKPDSKSPTVRVTITKNSEGKLIARWEVAQENGNWHQYGEVVFRRAAGKAR